LSLAGALPTDFVACVVVMHMDVAVILIEDDLETILEPLYRSSTQIRHGPVSDGY